MSVLRQYNSATGTWDPIMVGVQGAQGPQGNTGTQGAQGSVGAQGLQGYQGSVGAQGSQGTSYTAGYTAAGQVAYGTGNNAATTLGIGTQGQVLTVNPAGTAPIWASRPTVGSWTPQASGLKALSIDLATEPGTTTPTKGVMYLYGFYLQSPATFTNAFTKASTAGTTLSNCYMGVYSQNGTLLAYTGDISTNLQSATYAFTAAYNAPYFATEGVYYMALLIGNGSTTSPTMHAANGFTAAILTNPLATTSANTLAGNARTMTFGSGQTGLPGMPGFTAITASGLTPGLNINTVWMGIT